MVYKEQAQFTVINNLSLINVYKKTNIKSEIVTQLIYGDSFKISQRKKKWFYIRNKLDGYKGYIKKINLLNDYKNTHKICALKANIYSNANGRHKIKKKLSFGSRIKVIDKKNNFFQFNSYWVKKNDVKKIDYKSKYIFENLNKFINVKYKWGGKHFTGVDCSGLVQLLINFNNKYCPRNSKEQIKYFKKKIDLKNIKKNDLIFWSGHVAVATSKKWLVHAYGPMKKTTAMPIKKTIDRIYKTANLKVIGVRRIT